MAEGGSSTATTETSFDYVVVGAGSAGAVVAARLSEDPATRVLLLEAGPLDKQTEIHIPAAFSKLFKTPLDWDYASTPQASIGGRSLYSPRGKMLGGTSSMNAQVYLRGHREDFDEWARNGCVGWGYDDLLRYFTQAEDNVRGASAYHGVGGPLRVEELRDPNPLARAFVAACEQVGLPRLEDANAQPTLTEGAGIPQVTQKRGKRWSTADAYLRPAIKAKRPNLVVAVNAHATRVLFDANRRATGVEYRQAGITRTATARKEVILSGGTYNSPQFLLLSGIGPAEHLRAHGIAVVVDAPEVGANLQDHAIAPVYAETRQPITLLAAEKLQHVVNFLLRGRGMLTSNVVEGFAFARTDPSLSAPDVEILFAPVLFLDEGLTAPTVHGFSMGPMVLKPRSRGTVTLRSADPLDKPVIDPHFLEDADDLERLARGVELTRRILQAPAFAPYVAREMAPGAQAETPEGVVAYIRQKAHNIFHPVGTCRMGADERSVVDLALRVRGVEGLRVVDASVMPSVTRGHTHAPAVAIGEKAADLIRAGTSAAAPSNAGATGVAR